jgi:ankyrin repeat protein
MIDNNKRNMNSCMKSRAIYFFLTVITVASVAVPSTVTAASVDELVTAVWGFDTKKVTELIDSGVDINGTNSQGTTALLLACSFKDNDEMIGLLLDKGADPNVRGPRGETALGFAARYSVKAVKMLLDKGADINAKDDAGWTALKWANQMKQSEVVKFLKDNGAKE